MAGNVDSDQIKLLAEKWFGNIPKGKKYVRNLPKEPVQTQENRLVLKRNVPSDSIYLAWHMPDRLNKNYYAIDLLSDILSGGKSSRFYNSLIKEKQLFTNVDAYITGSIDEGLFVISGNIREGISVEQAEAAILDEIKKLKLEKIEEKELQKVKNKTESTLLFSELTALNKAMNLAYYELLGKVDDINHQIEKYQAVTVVEIGEFVNKNLIPSNCSVLHYLKENKNE